MPEPTTTAEFLEFVQQSCLVPAKRLDAFLQQRRPSDLPAKPLEFAQVLINAGLLTHFQAEQILLGRWKRFTIGKYRILDRLGAGAMGTVFLCEHPEMRNRVAIKVLPPVFAKNPDMVKRFYREARAGGALDHKNIVRVYDVDQDDKVHFMVLEYVDGSILRDIVTTHGPLSALRAAHYIRQAAVGLQHAHQAGLIHRDLKPANLLLDRSGTIKMLDLGLARFADDEDDVLTKGVLGTADYLAPEQTRDSHQVDIRADIYSLGGTFYFLLTGGPPFGEGGTVAQKLIAHQSKEPKPIRSLRAEVPEALTTIVTKMMVKDPAQRYQTPAAVVEALAPWTQTPIPAPPAAEMPRVFPAVTEAPSPPAPRPPHLEPPSTITGTAPRDHAARTAPALPTTERAIPPGFPPRSPEPSASVGQPSSKRKWIVFSLAILAAAGGAIWWTVFRGLR